MKTKDKKLESTLGDRMNFKDKPIFKSAKEVKKETESVKRKKIL